MTPWGWIGWALAVFFGDLLLFLGVWAACAANRVADAEAEARRLAIARERILKELEQAWHETQHRKEEADFFMGLANYSWERGKP